MTNHERYNDKNLTEQQEQQNGIEQQEHYNYYNNYHTDPGVFRQLPPDEAMQLIAEAYRANIGDTITQAAAHLIEDALSHGMEPDTVILAIEETGLASRPSPYYLRAVLRNWAESGVTVSRARNRQGMTDAWPWWKTR